MIKNLPMTQWWGEIWTTRILISVAAVLFLIIIFNTSGRKELSANEKWAVVQRGHFAVDLIESGDIEAVFQRPINAPMMRGSSTLQIIELIPDGKMVKKGDFLVQFDASELRTSLDLRQAQLESLRSDLEKLKAQQSLTISNQERSIQVSTYSYQQALLRLEMRKFESEVKKEEARLEVKQAEIALNRVKKQNESQKIIHQSQLIKMEMSIREQENRVEEYKKRIEAFTIYAPLDGMVVYQEVGSWNSRERLKNGYQARPGETLMAIPDLSHMEVKLYINEVDRLKVLSQQRVEIRLDAYPDIVFHGKVISVSRLAQAINWESSVKGFIAYADIEGSNPILKPGMTAKVRIVLEEYEDVLYIPVGTVFEVDGQSVVFPARKGKPMAVYLGPRNDANVIVERGLKDGTNLSWVNPMEKSAILGLVEERRRIIEVNRTIEESFQVFQELGILYDYEDDLSIDQVDNQQKKSNFDLNKLPSSLRNKLLQKEESTESKPKVEVGSTDGKQKQGTFKVSPDMMKRLQEKKSENN